MGTLGKAIYTVGFWIRETGQAIDRLGSRLQGNYYFQEQCNLSLSLSETLDFPSPIPFLLHLPRLDSRKKGGFSNNYGDLEFHCTIERKRTLESWILGI